MSKMLPAEPANSYERQHQRQYHKKCSRSAFAHAALHENEAHHERQRTVHHAPKQQPQWNSLIDSKYREATRGLHDK